MNGAVTIFSEEIESVAQLSCNCMHACFASRSSPIYAQCVEQRKKKKHCYINWFNNLLNISI